MRKADYLPSCAVVTKSGNLKFLEPSGPVTGPLYLYILPYQATRIGQSVQQLATCWMVWGSSPSVYPSRQALRLNQYTAWVSGPSCVGTWLRHALRNLKHFVEWMSTTAPLQRLLAMFWSNFILYTPWTMSILSNYGIAHITKLLLSNGENLFILSQLLGGPTLANTKSCIHCPLTDTFNTSHNVSSC